MTPTDLANQLRDEAARSLASIRLIADSIEAMSVLPDSSLLVFPTNYRPIKITGEFGDDRGTWVHEGLDISLPVSTPVYAPHAGKVISAKFNTSYGNRVRIEWTENGERWWAWLAHLTRFFVGEGAIVEAGGLVGYSGSTGNSTGPHLHLSVQRESNTTLLRGIPEVLRGCVNPREFLQWPT